MADEYIKEATEACLAELNALKMGRGLISSFESAWDNKVAVNKKSYSQAGTK
jgi:hypothetical protein